MFLASDKIAPGQVDPVLNTSIVIAAKKVNVYFHNAITWNAFKKFTLVWPNNTGRIDFIDNIYDTFIRKLDPISSRSNSQQCVFPVQQYGIVTAPIFQFFEY